MGIGAADNPGFLAKRAWESGEILEAVMYDEEKRPQGKGLARHHLGGKGPWKVDDCHTGGG